MRSRIILLLLAAILGCGAATGSALASRAPTRAEQRGITKAVLQAIPRSIRPKIEVKGIRVTTVRLYGLDLAPFASANEVPKPPFRDTVQAQRFVVERVPTASSGWRWVTVSYGTAFVGCGVVPLAYLRDLNPERPVCG